MLIVPLCAASRLRSDEEDVTQHVSVVSPPHQRSSIKCIYIIFTTCSSQTFLFLFLVSFVLRHLQPDKQPPILEMLQRVRALKWNCDYWNFIVTHLSVVLSVFALHSEAPWGDCCCGLVRYKKTELNYCCLTKNPRNTPTNVIRWRTPQAFGPPLGQS